MEKNNNTKRSCKFVTFCLSNEVSPNHKNYDKEDTENGSTSVKNSIKPIQTTESPKTFPKNDTLQKPHHTEHESKDEEISSGGTISRQPITSRDEDMTSLTVETRNEDQKKLKDDAMSPLVSPGMYVQITDNISTIRPENFSPSNVDSSILAIGTGIKLLQSVPDDPVESSPDDDDFCIRIIPPPPIDGSAEHVEAHVEYDLPDISKNGGPIIATRRPDSTSVPFKPRNPSNGTSFNLLSLVTSVSQGHNIGQPLPQMASQTTSPMTSADFLHHQSSWSDRSFHIKSPPFPPIIEDAEQVSSFSRNCDNKTFSKFSPSGFILPWKSSHFKNISFKKDEVLPSICNTTNHQSNKKKGVKYQRWQYGLFQCHKNWKTALYSFFFPCFVERQLSSVTNNPELSQVLTLLTVVCFIIPLLVILSLVARQTVLMWVCIVLFCAQMFQKLGFLVKLRINVRLVRNIDGACCQDCCSVFLCCPCALCQMKQELDFWPDLHQSRA